MKLKTLVIIDDEIFFRKAVCNFIAKQNDFRIIGEANNGISGIHLITSLKPDIALVDISMPAMNGLEMIRKLTADRPVTKFILLTGYGDFEYARQAISLGVKDYLLKPLDNQELLSCLEKLSVKIDEENSRQYFISDYFQKENIYKQQLTLNFFHKIIAGNFQQEEFSVLQSQMGITQTQYYLVLLVRINKVNPPFCEAESDCSLLHSIVENISTEILSPAYPFLLYIDYSRLHQYIILGNSNGDFGSLELLCISLSRILQETAHTDCTFFAGTAHAGTRGIRVSYEESLSALHNNYFNASSPYRIFHKGDESADFYVNADTYGQIMILLRQKNESRLLDYFSEYFGKMQAQNLHIRQIWNIALSFFTVLDSFVCECGCHNKTASILQDAYDTYQNCENIGQLAELVSRTYSHVLAEISRSKEPESASFIKEVQDYIASNYSHPDLRLETIASHFYMNSQYLSTLFSRETHITLTAYINNFRMQKAKELLLSQSPSVQNTASLCGFTDSGYFSKCFRKFYGISPKNFLALTERKYREKIE